MFKKVRTAVAALLVLVALAAVPAMAAQPTAKSYTGGWITQDTNPTVRMEIFDDGTMYYVFGDDQSTGYYYGYFIDGDGTLCIYDDDAIIDAFAMLNQNLLLDYEGLVWTRTY